MPDKLLLTAANVLKLEDDRRLLDAIGNAVARFADLKLKIASLADATDLLHRIAAGLESADVAKAFDELGLKDVHDTLAELLGKVVDAEKKIPAKYKALLKPLSEFPADTDDALVEWSVATPAKPAIKTDRYTLDLAASAGVTLDAFAKWPGDDASPKLLRIGAHGEVKASAGATIPYTFGPIKAGAGVSAKPALDYYFAPAGNPIFASAVATRLVSLPDPFDFESVWEGFEDPNLHLEGLVYEFTGGANANVNVAVANPIPLGKGLVGDLGVKVGVSASLNSTYRLRLRRSASGFRATLSRDRVTEEKFNAELKLEVDIGKVAEPVIKELKGLATNWDDALAEIRPFLSPGTYLRDKLGAELTQRLAVLVHDDELRKAILSDAKGALGLEEPGEPKIVAWLQDKVAGAIDQGSALVDGQADKALDRVMANLGRALPVLAANDPSAQLKSLVAEQLATLEKRLGDAVAEVLKKPSSTVKKALEKTHTAVSGAITSADALLKPVRELLKTYDDALHKMLDNIEKGAKQKASVRLFAEETNRDQTIVEIEGEFTDKGAGQKIFEALTRGTMKPLIQLIDTGNVRGFDLDEANSSATRFSEYKSKQGLEIMFFGITANYGEFVSSDAKVKLDGHGNVLVDTSTELKKQLSLGSDREVAFTDVHALVLAKAMRDAGTFGKPTLEVGISASYSEKFLDPQDVDRFIGGLARARLVSDRAGTEAAELFATWEAAAPGGNVRADITADLILSGRQIETLLRLDQRNADSLTDAARQEIVHVGLKWQEELKTFGQKQYEAGRAHALQSWVVGAKPKTEEELILGFRKGIAQADIREQDRVPVATATALGAQTDFTYFLRQAYGLQRLVALIDDMGAVYTATPAVGGGPGWDATEYRDRQKSIARSSRYQLSVATTVANLFKSDITPRTLAFMATIAELAGPDDAGVPLSATVTLTNRTDPAKPVPVGFK